MMSFEKAVGIVKVFGGGFLLDGLEKIRHELDLEYDGEAEAEITKEERLAYYVVIKNMRPLFV
jgi:hypothetical protein